MINSLTAHQKEQLNVCRDRGIAVGLSTSQFSLQEASLIVWGFEEKILKRAPSPVFIFDGPLHAWYAIFLIRYLLDASVRNQVSNQVSDQVWNQVWDQVSNQVRNQVSDQISNQISDQVWDQVRDQVWDQVSNQVWNQISDQISNQISDQVSDQVRNQISDQVWDQVSNQVWNQISDQVRNQISDQVSDQVWDQVWNQVWNQISNQVRNQVSNQVRNQVSNQVRDQVWDQVRDQVSNQVPAFFAPYTCGAFDSCVFAFYDYFIDNNLVSLSGELVEKYNAWKNTSKLGFIYFLENFVVVSQKPLAIHKNSLGLHCEGGASLEYADGTKVWALNGVRVPQYLAETPSGKLDIEFYISEKNADIKTEFVRKYGVERMLDFGRKIDTFENYDEEWWTKSQYQLWDMANIFEGVSYAPHLKMLNQTTGIWHVEAVSPNCRTVRDAIKERFGGRDFTIKSIQ